VAAVAAGPRAEAAAVDAAAVVVADAVVDQERMIMMKAKFSMDTALAVVRACALFAACTAAPWVLAQAAYPTPQAAADALVDGIARHDGDAIKTVVGADYRKYIPAASVDPEDVTNFLAAWAAAHGIQQDGADRAFLQAGTKGWTLPIPIVKTAAGWSFDTKGAPAEMRKRRIGRNELAAIQVALAYTDAQEEYYAKDPDRQGVKHFAMRGLSSPGKRDGLYWASLPGEEESPLGPDFADAKRGQPYHGYLYKILTAQGKDAPGGAKSYVRNGKMTDGYALVAWPERWNDTGVMTFIVNRDGIVYQKDLGANTDAAARAITAYNPDSSWERVAPAK
jgi:hypothetical protein